MSNHWFIYTSKALTWDDIRAAAEASLVELLDRTAENAWKPLVVFSLDNRRLSNAELQRQLVGSTEAEGVEAILRTSTEDQVFVEVTKDEVSFGLETKSALGTLLAIAAAIGVARTVGSKADYGYSILPDVQATREWEGHDPDELVARLRLQYPAPDLATGVRRVLAATVFAEP